MNVLYIAHEFPYPANHGGRVDIWNRILALKFLGVNVFLLSWSDVVKGEFPSTESMEFVKRHVSGMEILPINRNLARIYRMLNTPSLVSARSLSSKIYTDLISRMKYFKPSFIFVDGIYGGEIGLKISKELDCKIGVRLHNIEHVYMSGQFKLAHSLKDKLSIGLALIHLKKYEQRIVKSATAFFDISLNDLEYWVKRGYDNGYWLPPVVYQKSSGDTIFSGEDFKYDLCFFGNLRTPNNVEGVSWFISEVMPNLNKEFKNLSVLIMGSNPSEEIRYDCSKNSNITLIANPKSPEEFLRHSRVLFNPVQFGSGVNIKSIEMLFTDKHVVTTSVGIRGLPREFLDVFDIADTPNEFKDAILSILRREGSNSLIKDRTYLRHYFEKNAVKIILDKLT